MAAATVVPLSEYLETKLPSGLRISGWRTVERNVGELDHGRLQGLLSCYLGNREKQSGIWVLPEQRVQVKPSRFRVPNITVLTGPFPADQIVQQAPFLCIEILSPSDRMGEMQDRIDDYLNFGVRYVWLIHPKTRRAFVYTAEGVWEAKDGVLSTEGPEIRVSLDELE